MVLAKVVLERIIVDIVLLFATTVTSIANVAAFVLVSAVCVQLVVAVKSLSTKATFWVPLESTLVDGAWVIIAKLLVLPQLGECEELVFVSKDFFVSCAEVAAGC